VSETASTLSYNARNKPPNADTVRLYRPRVFNRVSRTRFERNRLGELARHVGRPLSFAEKIIANRICAIEWELLRTDAKLDAGHELSGHDIRGRLAAENRLRLDLQALGMQPQKPAAPVLSDVLATIGRRSRT